MSFYVYISLVLDMHTCEDLDKSRFARAVFAHERVYLSFTKRKINIPERLNSGKGFIYPTHFQQ